MIYYSLIMGKQDPQKPPFQKLGIEIRSIRTIAGESIKDLALALEVTPGTLSLVEKGQIRPDEDILDMIFARYGVNKRSGDKIWKLAGYDVEQDIDSDHNHTDELHMPSFGSGKMTAQLSMAVIPMPFPSPSEHIVYTDSIGVTVNNFGVTLTFMQGGTPDKKAVTVSQVGMSKEHAKNFLQTLTKTLQESEQKQTKPQNLLSPPDNS
jgi:transcriptional regulator with XRE-family HTH domain